MLLFLQETLCPRTSSICTRNQTEPGSFWTTCSTISQVTAAAGAGLATARWTLIPVFPPPPSAPGAASPKTVAHSEGARPNDAHRLVRRHSEISSRFLWLPPAWNRTLIPPIVCPAQSVTYLPCASSPVSLQLSSPSCATTCCATSTPRGSSTATVHPGLWTGSTGRKASWRRSPTATQTSSACRWFKNK